MSALDRVLLAALVAVTTTGCGLALLTFAEMRGCRRPLSAYLELRLGNCAQASDR